MAACNPMRGWHIIPQNWPCVWGWGQYSRTSETGPWVSSDYIVPSGWLPATQCADDILSPKTDHVYEAEADIQGLQRQDPELVLIISYLRDGCLQLTELCWRETFTLVDGVSSISVHKNQTFGNLVFQRNYKNNMWESLQVILLRGRCLLLFQSDIGGGVLLEDHSQWRF